MLNAIIWVPYKLDFNTEKYSYLLSSVCTLRNRPCRSTMPNRDLKPSCLFTHNMGIQHLQPSIQKIMQNMNMVKHNNDANTESRQMSATMESTFTGNYNKHGKTATGINKIINTMFHGLYTACFSTTPKYRSTTYASILTILNIIITNMTRQYVLAST